MLELVEHLQAQALDIRYDQVVLQIGDSLIHKISREIADGDFLIAIISPDSVDSGWCQKELSLAATQDINEKRAKVLPVLFRGARVPEMFGDTFYGDADRFSAETIAEKLVTAMRAHLEGRGDEAGREAEAVEPAEGEPPHAEAAGDVEVGRSRRWRSGLGICSGRGRASGLGATSATYPTHAAAFAGHSTSFRLGFAAHCRSSSRWPTTRMTSSSRAPISCRSSAICARSCSPFARASLKVCLLLRGGWWSPTSGRWILAAMRPPISGGSGGETKPGRSPSSSAGRRWSQLMTICPRRSQLRRTLTAAAFSRRLSASMSRRRR